MVKLPPDEDTPEKRVNKIFDMMDQVKKKWGTVIWFLSLSNLNVRTRMEDSPWKNSEKGQGKIQRSFKLWICMMALYSLYFHHTRHHHRYHHQHHHHHHRYAQRYYYPQTQHYLFIALFGGLFYPSLMQPFIYVINMLPFVLYRIIRPFLLKRIRNVKGWRNARLGVDGVP